MIPKLRQAENTRSIMLPVRINVASMADRKIDTMPLWLSATVAPCRWVQCAY